MRTRRPTGREGRTRGGRAGGLQDDPTGPADGGRIAFDISALFHAVKSGAVLSDGDVGRLADEIRRLTEAGDPRLATALVTLALARPATDARLGFALEAFSCEDDEITAGVLRAVSRIWDRSDLVLDRMREAVAHECFTGSPETGYVAAFELARLFHDRGDRGALERLIEVAEDYRRSQLRDRIYEADLRSALLAAVYGYLDAHRRFFGRKPPLEACLALATAALDGTERSRRKR